MRYVWKMDVLNDVIVSLFIFCLGNEVEIFVLDLFIEGIEGFE